MEYNFVLHARKIHTEIGCTEVLKHNLRKKPNLEDFIDVNKSIFNYYDGATIGNFSEKFKEFTANLPRKIQKNASRIIEFAVSFSHEFGEDWETNQNKKMEIENYFNNAEAFLKRRYGDFVISRTDHYDEKTPHSHLLLVPLCKNKNGIIRFSSSEFLGGIKGLYDLHDKFHSEVGKKYGLKRGNRGERTKHSDLKDYAEWEKSQRLVIDKKNKQLNDQLEDARRQQYLNTQNEHFLNEEKKKLLKQRGILLEKTDLVLNKEEGLKLLDENILEKTPQIPMPPVKFTKKSRKQWMEKIQNLINEPFTKIFKGYIFLKNNYDNLCKRLKKLTNLNQQYKERAEKAEKDLIEKPINEILAMREKAKKPELNNTKNNEYGKHSR
jgi:Fe-S cluster biosynthesis and repair protein YggX